MMEIKGIYGLQVEFDYNPNTFLLARVLSIDLQRQRDDSHLVQMILDSVDYEGEFELLGLNGRISKVYLDSPIEKKDTFRWQEYMTLLDIRVIRLDSLF